MTRMRQLMGEVTTGAGPRWLGGRVLLVIAIIVTAGGAARAWRPFVTPQGALIRWKAETPPIVVEPDWPDVAEDAVIVGVVNVSIGTWNAVDCGQPRFRVAGANDKAALNADDGLTSIIWYDDVAAWNARFSALELARTVISYRVSSGAMVDADIAVNMGGYAFNTNTVCDPELYDFESMLTHELGHVLGLDHSAAEGATMFQRTEAGTCAIRDLDPDDVEGLCSMYPVAEPAEPSPEQAPEMQPETGPEPMVERVPERAEPVDGSRPPEDCSCKSGAGAGGAPLGFVWLVWWRFRRGSALRASGSCRR